MHELPILREVVKVAIRHAELAEANKVVSVALEIGELRDLDDLWMQRYFNFVTADTMAAGATLQISRSRALFRCQACTTTFPVDLRSQEPKCTSCGDRTIELITGNELRIESIDVA